MRKSIVAALALAASMLACGRNLPQGQFGPYHRQNGSLTLPSGQSVKVYRLKYWEFTSGEPPAFQLEYEAPFPVSDTVAVHREALVLWPYFAPYLNAHRLRSAIITASNFHVSGFWPYAWTSGVHSFGMTAAKYPDGHWRFDRDTAALPEPDASTPRLRDSMGAVIPFTTPLPAAASR